MVAGASVFSSCLPAFFLTGPSRAGVIDVSKNVCSNPSIAGTLLVNPGIYRDIVWHAWKVKLHYIPPEHIVLIQVLAKDSLTQPSHYLNCTAMRRPEPHGNTIPSDPEGIFSFSQVIGEVACQIDPFLKCQSRKKFKNISAMSTSLINVPGSTVLKCEFVLGSMNQGHHKAAFNTGKDPSYTTHMTSSPFGTPKKVVSDFTHPTSKYLRCNTLSSFSLTRYFRVGLLSAFEVFCKQGLT
jgi:hypothetical protein